MEEGGARKRSRKRLLGRFGFAQFDVYNYRIWFGVWALESWEGETRACKLIVIQLRFHVMLELASNLNFRHGFAVYLKFDFWTGASTLYRLETFGAGRII